MIHRDLKPANVMLTPGGAKVLDFGLAKWPGGDSGEALAASPATVHPTLTQAGSVVGTIQYMAPEQLEGKPADALSDLFALGAIIYEMTIARRAFEGTSTASVMAAILSNTPSPMVALQPVTPAALDRVVRMCLAKDPIRRWQTVTDLRDELAWIREDVAAGAEAISPSPMTPVSVRFWKRLAWTLAIAAGILVLLVLAFVTRAGPQGQAAVRFVVLPPEKTTGADVPIVSPDGQKLAFVARAADGRSALWIRSFDSLESRPVADADELALPFWSPDSRSVAFFAQASLTRVDAAVGRLRSFATRHRAAAARGIGTA